LLDLISPIGQAIDERTAHSMYCRTSETDEWKLEEPRTHGFDWGTVFVPFREVCCDALYDCLRQKHDWLTKLPSFEQASHSKKQKPFGNRQQAGG